MSVSMIKDSDHTVQHIPTAQASSVLRRWFNDRLARRKQLRQQWHDYNDSQRGRGVSYRMWLRHGAYLEMHRQRDVN